MEPTPDLIIRVDDLRELPPAGSCLVALYVEVVARSRAAEQLAESLGMVTPEGDAEQLRDVWITLDVLPPGLEGAFESNFIDKADHRDIDVEPHARLEGVGVHGLVLGAGGGPDIAYAGGEGSPKRVLVPWTKIVSISAEVSLSSADGLDAIGL